MKTVYSFKCKEKSLRSGFSLDETGANIPTTYCSKGWEFNKSLDIDENTNLIGVSAKAILKGIEERGYYISEAEITITEK